MHIASLGTQIETWLDRRPATAHDDPAWIPAKDHHWLLCVVAVSSGGDIDVWIEESDDGVTGSEVTGSRVSLNANDAGLHMAHTFVVDRSKRKAYVRVNFEATAGGPATSFVSLKLHNQTHIDGGPYPADVATDGQPGSVSIVT